MTPNIKSALAWRYATKKFDASKKLSPEQLDYIMEALRLTPSSTGLQPWAFVDVQNPEIRLKLKSAAWGQSQITDADHLIVLCSIRNLDEKNVDDYLASVAQTRGGTVESLKGYKDMIMGNITGKTPEWIENWSAKQVYIALGTGLLTAALLGVDATPMEGFDKKQFDEILGLEAKGLSTQVVLALGFRASDDVFANLKKVRFPKEKVVLVI